MIRYYQQLAETIADADSRHFSKVADKLAEIITIEHVLYWPTCQEDEPQPMETA